MSDKFSLKDHLFNKKSVTYFADLFYRNDSDFPKEKFIKNVISDFPSLELKNRISRMCDELYLILPSDYLKAREIILRALPSELDPSKTDDDFGEFILAPMSYYIARYGCNKEYVNDSLEALSECTKRFSAEDAIRYFINKFPKQTIKFLKKCASSDNYHVRRLASEGTRPSLPWCINIKISHIQTVLILDMLFADSTRYVTRSVANHMNDISKIDADFVIQKLTQWKFSQKQDEREMQYIMNHSLRTLVRRGNKKALTLLGYSQPKVKISNFLVHTPIVVIGEKLEFSCEIVSLKYQSLMIDYVVHHKIKSGKTHQKVFKIKKGSFNAGESIRIYKKQAFRVMTTRKLYPGEHLCEIQINGDIVQSFFFTLV